MNRIFPLIFPLMSTRPNVFNGLTARGRIRDKIAASKKKGMWMGGVPPLGYGVRDHKLVMIDSEADRSIDLPPLCRTRLSPLVTGGARSARDQK